MPFKRRSEADVRSSLNDDIMSDEEFMPYCVTRGGHAPVAGMMVVHPEDLDSVARSRGKVECENCDYLYRAGKGWVLP